MEEVISSEYRIKAISSLSSRIQEKLDAYLVEMRIQYPETQFTSVDIHDLLNTLTRLQVCFTIMLAIFISSNLSGFYLANTILSIIYLLSTISYD